MSKCIICNCPIPNDRQTCDAHKITRYDNGVEMVIIDPVENPVSSVDKTLAERGARYGSFDAHAQITQALKRTAMIGKSYKKLTDSQQEALEMIFHKIGRILNGDPNYADSWHDIAGYAKLVEDELNGQKQNT